MATVESSLLNAEAFWEWLPRNDNGRLYELERGEIVEMPPPGFPHGLVCSLLAHFLWLYVTKRGKGLVCSNDTGLLVESDPDTVRGPDVMFFDENWQFDKLPAKYATAVPRLIAEVLSPNDQTTKVNRRISQYLKLGVPLVWLVDPEVRSVTVYQPHDTHRVLDETEELNGGDALPDFRCRVADLFAPPKAPGAA